MAGDWRDTSVPRRAELEQLQAAWRLACGGVPQVAAIVAESGYGKTRLAQDFFAWLSREVDAAEPDGYWPDRLGRHADNLRVNPVMDGVLAGHADMPFLWWGVRIADPGRRNQQFSSALSHAKFDLADHLARYAICEAERVRADETASARRKLAFDLGVDFAGNLMSFGLLGVMKNISEFRSELQQIDGRYGAAVGGAGSQEIDLVNLILADLRRICAPQPGGQAPVPLVVLIDDAQWLASDAMMAVLVERMIETALAEDWPLLLLLTSWEREWASDVQGRLVQVGARPLVIPVGPLDLGAIVRAALPGLSRAQRKLVGAAVDGNPLFGTYLIEALLGDHAHFAGRTPTGALSPLGEEFVAGATIQDIVERRFVDSPSEMQKVLGLAALQGIRFSPALALRTAAILGDRADRTLLDRADTPFAFVSIRSAAEAEFRQRRLREAARKRLRHFIDEDEARVALDQAMTAPDLGESENGLEITAQAIDHPDPARRTAALYALVELTKRALHNFDRASAAYAAGLFLDRAQADRHQFMHTHGADTLHSALIGTPRHTELADLYFEFFRLTRAGCTIDGVLDPAAHGGMYRDTFSALGDVLPRIVVSLDRSDEDRDAARDAARIGVDLQRARLAAEQASGAPPDLVRLRDLRVALQRLSDLTPLEQTLPLIEEQLALAQAVALGQTRYDSAPDLSNTLLRHANALRATGRRAEQRRALEQRVELWREAVSELPDLRNVSRLLTAELDLVASRPVQALWSVDGRRIQPLLQLGYRTYYSAPGGNKLVPALAQLVWLMGRRLRGDTATRAFAKRIEADLGSAQARLAGDAPRWQVHELADLTFCAAALHRATGDRRALAEAMDRCIALIETRLLPEQFAADTRLVLQWHIRAGRLQFRQLRLGRAVHHLRRFAHYSIVMGEIMAGHGVENPFAVMRSGGFLHWERKSGADSGPPG